ncbi:MAG: hypothetical protein ABSG64_08770 [Solirubrobacteraceae bacterium]|jgi:hypothetical protein
MDRVLMRRPRAVTVAVAVMLLGAPASAWASGKIVAPGDPGSSQYQEDIPTAAGSVAVSSIKPGTAGVALPRTVARQLAADGTAGRTTAVLAEVTTPSPTPKPAHHAVRPARVLISQPAGTVAMLARSMFGSGGGMGAFLPILLAVSFGVAIILALRRRKG